MRYWLDRSASAGCAGDETMANSDVRAWRHSEIGSPSVTSTEGRFSDDGLDFPPTAHPVRELITFGIFLSGVIALLIWGGSKLLQAIF
jgi:hypothetical protein